MQIAFIKNMQEQGFCEEYIALAVREKRMDDEEKFTIANTVLFKGKGRFINGDFYVGNQYHTRVNQNPCMDSKKGEINILFHLIVDCRSYEEIKE